MPTLKLLGHANLFTVHGRIEPPDTDSHAPTLLLGHARPRTVWLHMLLDAEGQAPPCTTLYCFAPVALHSFVY